MEKNFSTIVYLSIIPLSEKISKDFYIDALINSGFKVEFWDISEIYSETVINTNHDYHKRFKNKSDIKKHFSLYANYKDTLFLINIAYTYQFIFIYRLLKKFNCSTALFARGMIPTGGGNNSDTKVLIKILNPFRLLRNVKIVYSLLIKKYNLTKRIDFIFQAGTEGAKVLGLGYNEDFKTAKKIIQINYFDYDNYLESNCKNETSKTIVFLDEYLPFHPDFDLLKMEKVKASVYFKEINNFFNLIEEKTSCKVIIAAHPKANYDVNPFNKREIYYGKTLELVKKSELVIAHASTSISMAVCGKKKIELLDSNLFKINNGHISNILKAFSNSLNLRVINMSDKKYDFSNSKIDEYKYKQYLNTYLTSNESKDKLTKNIFIEFLTKKSV